MTEPQFELMRDKFVLWSRAARDGQPDLRDYNRRCADALKQLLAEHSEYIPISINDEGNCSMSTTNNCAAWPDGNGTA